MKDSKVVIVLLGIVAVFIIGVTLEILAPVIIPLVIAAFLSYLFKPLVLFLQKRNVPTFLSLTLVFVLIGGVLFGFSAVIFASVESFVAEAPKYQDRIDQLVGSLFASAETIGEQIGVPIGEVEWQSLLNVSMLTGLLGSGLGTTVGFAGNVILVLLYLAFMLAATGNFTAKIRKGVRRGGSEKIGTIAGRIDTQVRRYLLTKTLLSLAAATITTIVLLAFGVPFALFWGFLTFLMSYIPNVGSLISQILPVLMALLHFDSIVTPIIILAILFGIETIIGRIVEPKVMSYSLDLSPLVVLVALIFWSWLWGIVGAVLAVPMTAVLKIILENIDELKPIASLMGDGTDAAESDAAA